MLAKYTRTPITPSNATVWAQFPNTANVFFCPTSVQYAQAYDCYVSYGMNEVGVGGCTLGPVLGLRKESQIRQASRQIVFLDTVSPAYAPFGWYAASPTTAGMDWLTTDYRGVSFRHGGFCNTSYADGHVEAVARKSLTLPLTYNTVWPYPWGAP